MGVVIDAATFSVACGAHTHALHFLPSITPIQMAEIQLLRDALVALDDLFLLVVVGEFNSGE